ncbi:MAG: glucosamine-6-phosphate deaminase [Massilibacteroides sp.]|nr:glucosamine-6-phosphate deaminase [Massilibacteroides sp.]MDD3061286.1 glucosamine-6-phosphate deaminase [Massilibacteroides sp.]MDD4114875.1 glucosamine-6-phosphate deaminase [Massilibacteroides sp.]MDD4659783.1 glucosamine-6-phosphate deaminase [Massilibacteroides sp.]
MSLIKSFKKDLLQVRIYESRAEMGEVAAADVAVAIRTLLDNKAEVNMVFAAAPSQNEFLDALCSEKGIEWNRVNAFHMDEYVGLPEDAPQRFGNFLRERIFSRLPFNSVNYIDGNSPDKLEECKRYTHLLEQYPIDIVCMGIGENGHIAFNDPHVAKENDPEWMKVVDLEKICRLQQVNDGCFTTLDEVPTYAFTLTVPTLMRGKQLFCVVPGQTKAWAVAHTINHLISEKIPATFLRKHKNAILYLEPDSAKELFLTPIQTLV